MEGRTVIWRPDIARGRALGPVFNFLRLLVLPALPKLQHDRQKLHLSGLGALPAPQGHWPPPAPRPTLDQEPEIPSPLPPKGGLPSVGNGPIHAPAWLVLPGAALGLKAMPLRALVGRSLFEVAAAMFQGIPGGFTPPPAASAPSGAPAPNARATGDGAAASAAACCCCPTSLDQAFIADPEMTASNACSYAVFQVRRGALGARARARARSALHHAGTRRGRARPRPRTPQSPRPRTLWW